MHATFTNIFQLCYLGLLLLCVVRFARAPHIPSITDKCDLMPIKYNAGNVGGAGGRAMGFQRMRFSISYPTVLLFFMLMCMFVRHSNGSPGSELDFYSFLTHIRCRSGYFKTVGKMHSSSVRVQMYFTKIIPFQLTASCMILIALFVSWVAVLIAQAGDIHPNPGPISTSSSNETDISSLLI